MRALFLTIILFFITNNIYSQNIIHGNIKDAETNEFLSYTNIYIEGTYIGTVSNKNGYFSLELPTIPATVIISYIGYETRKLFIDKQGEFKLDVKLKPVVLELKGLVVTTSREDPAIEIMKKVIANKIKWKSKLKSYRAKAYTRTKVKNDIAIVSMSESVSKLYWNLERGSAEEFIAKKSSKRMPYLTAMNVGSKNILNFSDDNIKIINHSFVGPTHPDAFDYYDFKLRSERILNDKIVFDIQLIPKSKLQPLFSGKISILDEEFAIIDVDLKNSGNMSFFEMLKYFHGTYRQQYNNFGKEFWLPIDSRTEEIFEVDMGLIAFPQATFSKISRISNYEINIDVADDITRLDTTTTSSPCSSKILNVGAFKDFEKVPLTTEEIEAYTNPDTTKTLIKSFPPTGILAPYMISKEKELEAGLSEHGGYTPIKSNANFGFQGWYNRVEGLNVGLKFNYNFFDNYKIAITGGYQTYLRKFYYETQFKYLINKKNEDQYFFAGYYDKTNSRYCSKHYSQLVTSLLPLFGEYDYFDYYASKKFYVGCSYGIKKIKSAVFLEFNSEDNLSLTKTSNWNILNYGYSQRKNPAIDNGRLNSIKLQFTYYQAYNELSMERILGDKTDKIALQVEHSSAKYLKSDFSFTLYKFLFDYRLHTFFKRRPDYNYLRTRIEASVYTGTLPLQRFSIIDGSIFSYCPFGIFRTLLNKPLEGEKKFGLSWEYNFRSIPFEILGLNYFVRNKYEFIVFGALGRTWINKSRLQSISQNYKPAYKNELHNELGISLILKFKFAAIRLNAARNLENRKNYLGFSLNLIGMAF